MTNSGAAAERSGLRRAWPLLLLVGLAVGFYVSGGHRLLDLAALASQQRTFHDAIAAHLVLAPFVFVALYAIAIGCALPVGVVMSLASGWLFGTVLGGALAVIAATIGSTILFLAARSALRPLAQRVVGGWLGRSLPSLERNGFSTLLALRLLPFAPFWAVNLGAALTRIGLPVYVGATAVGIAPTTCVLASTGAGLGEMLAEGQAPGLDILLRPSIIVPLLLLAALSLVPLLVRKLRPGSTEVATSSPLP